MIPNKMTIPHLEHNITVKRADPTSPHYGYYFCTTCSKFVTWADKDTFNKYKKIQRNTGLMWFGIHQGKPLTEVPYDYLKWAVETFEPSIVGYEILVEEYNRRKHHK